MNLFIFYKSKIFKKKDLKKKLEVFFKFQIF